jgi:inner membrane protein involved in colicin E2 resistance
VTGIDLASWFLFAVLSTHSLFLPRCPVHFEAALLVCLSLVIFSVLILARSSSYSFAWYSLVLGSA